MNLTCVSLVAVLGIAQACAAAEFSAPIDVSPQLGPQTFYHLDATGRRNVAVSNDTVAVVWEDNRTGRPDAYIALKPFADKTFLPSRRINVETEAYAPGVTAAGSGFLVGWSEADAVLARYVDEHGVGQPVRLSTGPADQIAIAVLDNRTAMAVWVETLQNGTCIHAARLNWMRDSITAGRAFPVTDCKAQRFQAQPTLVAGPKGILVVWQDRSSGTNRIYGSVSKDAQHFSPPIQINETIQKSATYGSGSSAINPVVTQSAGRFWVLWLDKRAERSGYKIYSAQSADGLTWSSNAPVQDSFGDETPQWSVSVTQSSAGEAFAVWSDAREGNGQDVYYAYFRDGAWGDNNLIEHAAASRDQDSPALGSDAAGRIHLIWRHQPDEGTSCIKYAVGSRVADD